MKDSVSPEEKLLRIIRGEKSESVKKNPVLVSNVKPNVPVAVAPQGKRVLPPHAVRYSLYGAGGLLIVIVMLCLLFPSRPRRDIAVNEAVVQNEELPPGERTQDKKTLDFYLKGIEKHPLFAVLPSQVQGETEVINGDAEEDIASRLSLVGIISSSSNPQAILEDKKVQKTYYVSKNETLNGFTVENIEEGKVILSRNGKRYELRL